MVEPCGAAGAVPKPPGWADRLCRRSSSALPNCVPQHAYLRGRPTLRFCTGVSCDAGELLGHQLAASAGAEGARAAHTHAPVCVHVERGPAAATWARCGATAGGRHDPTQKAHHPTRKRLREFPIP